MKRLFALSTLAAVTALAQFGPSPQQIEQMKQAATLPTPKTADAHPDLNGYWGFNPLAAAANILGSGKVTLDGKVSVVAPEKEEQRTNIEGVARRLADTAARPVYKPESVAKAKENFERAAFLDPSYKCTPLGVPRVGPPTEIVQTPAAVYFL